MANTFIVEQTVGRTALSLLSRDLVLPRTVYRAAQAEYVGGKGETINIRKPASLTPRTYTKALRNAGTPIVMDDLTETTVPLVIDTIAYSAVAITDEDLTLNLVDFGVQVLDPMVKAVGIGNENALAAVMNGAGVTQTQTGTAAAPHAAILAARTTLNKKNVPMGDRWLAVSPEVEQYLLTDAENRLIRHDSSGDSPNTALRDAMVGRLYGFQVIVSNALTANTAIAYHMDAFAFASVAPAVPAGAAFGQSVSDAAQGLAMRYLRDYDYAFQRDRAALSSLVGAKVLDADRVVKITLTPPA